MPINSRAKGAAGERELAKALRDYGFEARRGQQYAGGGDSPDVVGLPGFHVEVKRVEAGNLYNWLKQAQRDAKPGNTPLVVHRRNQEQWVAILTLDDFIKLICDHFPIGLAPPVQHVGQEARRSVPKGKRGPVDLDGEHFPGYSDFD